MHTQPHAAPGVKENSLVKCMLLYALTLSTSEERVEVCDAK